MSLCVQLTSTGTRPLQQPPLSLFALSTRTHLTQRLRSHMHPPHWPSCEWPRLRYSSQAGAFETIVASLCVRIHDLEHAMGPALFGAGETSLPERVAQLEAQLQNLAFNVQGVHMDRESAVSGHTRGRAGTGASSVDFVYGDADSRPGSAQSRGSRGRHRGSRPTSALSRGSTLSDTADDLMAQVAAPTDSSGKHDEGSSTPAAGAAGGDALSMDVTADASRIDELPDEEADDVKPTSVQANAVPASSPQGAASSGDAGAVDKTVDEAESKGDDTSEPASKADEAEDSDTPTRPVDAAAARAGSRRRVALEMPDPEPTPSKPSPIDVSGNSVHFSSTSDTVTPLPTVLTMPASMPNSADGDATSPAMMQAGRGQASNARANRRMHRMNTERTLAAEAAKVKAEADATARKERAAAWITRGAKPRFDKNAKASLARRRWWWAYTRVRAALALSTGRIKITNARVAPEMSFAQRMQRLEERSLEATYKPEFNKAKGRIKAAEAELRALNTDIDDAGGEIVVLRHQLAQLSTTVSDQAFIIDGLQRDAAAARSSVGGGPAGLTVADMTEHLCAVTASLMQGVDRVKGANAVKGHMQTWASRVGSRDAATRATLDDFVSAVNIQMRSWPASLGEPGFGMNAVPASVRARHGMTEPRLAALVKDCEMQDEIKKLLRASMTIAANIQTLMDTRKSEQAERRAALEERRKARAEAGLSPEARERADAADKWETEWLWMWGDSSSDARRQLAVELVAALRSVLSTAWPQAISAIDAKGEEASVTPKAGGAPVMSPTSGEGQERKRKVQAMVKTLLESLEATVLLHSMSEFGVTLETRLGRLAPHQAVRDVIAHADRGVDALSKAIGVNREEVAQLHVGLTDAKADRGEIRNEVKVLQEEGIENKVKPLMEGLERAQGDVSQIQDELSRTVSKKDMELALAAVKLAVKDTATSSMGNSDINYQVRDMATQLQKKADHRDLRKLKTALEQSIAENAEPGLLVVRCLACNRPLRNAPRPDTAHSMPGHAHSHVHDHDHEHGPLTSPHVGLHSAGHPARMTGRSGTTNPRLLGGRPQSSPAGKSRKSFGTLPSMPRKPRGPGTDASPIQGFGDEDEASWADQEGPDISGADTGRAADDPAVNSDDNNELDPVATPARRTSARTASSDAGGASGRTSTEFNRLGMASDKVSRSRDMRAKSAGATRRHNSSGASTHAVSGARQGSGGGYPVRGHEPADGFPTIPSATPGSNLGNIRHAPQGPAPRGIAVSVGRSASQPQFATSAGDASPAPLGGSRGAGATAYTSTNTTHQRMMPPSGAKRSASKY